MNNAAEIKVGIIGIGGIANQVHYPGFSRNTRARVVAIADADVTLLKRRENEWDGVTAYDSAEALLDESGVDAVVIATPNCVHSVYAIAAAERKKHILCEKPLALSARDAQEMLDAAIRAGVRHMTAFTYRFVPAMRFLKHMLDRGDLGEPRHLRSQRFQDWGDGPIGWRQYKESAGSGELGDMTSHRIDFGHFLLGKIVNVAGHTRQFLPRDRDSNGNPVKPADTEDWVAIIGEFENGATGVWESTKLARGHCSGAQSHDFLELNGSEASAIYRLSRPYEVEFGPRGGVFKKIPVPREFLKTPAALRVPGQGDPSVVWRYDQAAEFMSAILEERECRPSFLDGVRCQVVMDAVIKSAEERRWVTIE